MTPESNPWFNGDNHWEYAIYCYGQDSRVCAEPTAYAEARGRVQAYSEEDAQSVLDNYGYDVSYAVGSSWWWLRSPGHISGYAASINRTGNVDYNGCNVHDGSGIGINDVRPALKVVY